jgi:aspartyl/glutamyl-tRNA(Asn/Gln) amidotransferase C subunit
MNVLRDDVPHVPFDTDTALANAPQRADGFFKVPPVLDPSAGA